MNYILNKKNYCSIIRKKNWKATCDKRLDILICIFIFIFFINLWFRLINFLLFVESNNFLFVLLNTHIILLFYNDFFFVDLFFKTIIFSCLIKISKNSLKLELFFLLKNIYGPSQHSVCMQNSIYQTPFVLCFKNHRVFFIYTNDVFRNLQCSK
jgi:hypothetical protein